MKTVRYMSGTLFALIVRKYLGAGKWALYRSRLHINCKRPPKARMHQRGRNISGEEQIIGKAYLAETAMMNRPAKDVLMAFCLLVVLVIVTGFSGGENVTIMGTVNEHYQIQSDENDIYTLGNGEKEKLMQARLNHQGIG